VNEKQKNKNERWNPCYNRTLVKTSDIVKKTQRKRGGYIGRPRKFNERRKEIRAAFSICHISEFSSLNENTCSPLCSKTSSKGMKWLFHVSNTSKSGSNPHNWRLVKFCRHLRDGSGFASSDSVRSALDRSMAAGEAARRRRADLEKRWRIYRTCVPTR